NLATVNIVDKYHDWWTKNYRTRFANKQHTFTSTDPFWPELLKTPLYKSVVWTFKGTGKTVKSI
ncbi:hypothetical protein LY78DRAFT_548700, partial [Colletotrichum sublineola]